jgi:RNA polymerase sigma-70 factor (ECF subfamily)
MCTLQVTQPRAAPPLNSPASCDILRRVKDSMAEAAQEPANIALARLFDAYGDKIYGLGLRMCASREDAEDLVQETFLRAHRSWSSFRGLSAPSTWLFTIAARTCKRLHRRKASEPRRLESFHALLPSDDEGYLDVPSPAEGPLDGVLRTEARAAAQKALRTMPVQFRIAFILKELGEFSMAEVAQILGIKEATVKTRVHRGRLHLAKQLKKRMPKTKTAPPDFDLQVCFAVFWAKMNALDERRPFKMPEDHICRRCESMFASMDLGIVAARELHDGGVPEPLRRLILKEFGT